RLRRTRGAEQDEGAAHHPLDAGAGDQASLGAHDALHAAPDCRDARGGRYEPRAAGTQREQARLVKLAIVGGTRPEIIKMAPIVRACESRRVPYALIHTGQHYSREMDGVFFDELELPAPTKALSVGSGTHLYQIAAIVAGMEPILAEVKPDVVL